MSDLQHGTLSGYKYRGCRCPDCLAAATRHEKQRRWLLQQGITLTVPAHGFNRRIRALMAIGWTQVDIARELGIAQGNLARKLRENVAVRRATHVAMCEVFDRLCMTPRHDPQGSRTARIAARRGWPPPLAWDDIDDLNEQPRRGGQHRSTDLDPVVVDRVLAGDRLPMTAAERREVVRRARDAGWSLLRIEAVTGITRPERFSGQPGWEREAVS